MPANYRAQADFYAPLHLIALFVCASLCCAGLAGADRLGSICLAPLPDNARELDHDYPDGQAPREYLYDFSVRVGDREPVRISGGGPQLIAGLALGKRYLVRIYDRDQVIESFLFTFEGRQAEYLCLSYTPWYQTWSLEKINNRRWCKCAEPTQ